MPRKKEMPQIDHSIKFIQEHHFKDTFALLVVFLSFNHFLSLCLLSVFILTTRSRYFLATCFIRLFLSKKSPSEPLRNPGVFTAGKGVSAVKSQQQQQQQQQQPTDQDSDRQQHQQQSSQPTSQQPTPLQQPQLQPQLSDDKNLSTPKRNAGFFKLSPLFVLEMLLASILKAYAAHYFTRPIENLAMSIIASSLINDPRDCLSYATSCSILYGLSLNVYLRLASLLKLKLLPHYSLPVHVLDRWPISVTEYPAFTTILPCVTQIAKWSSRYIRLCRYFASVHVVFYQFFQNVTGPRHLLNSGKAQNSPPPPTSSMMSPSISQSSIGHNGSSLPNTSGIMASPLSTSTNGPPLLALPKINAHKARFTDVVTDLEMSELSINSPSESNQQTITTNVTSSQSTSGNDEATYTNHFFELHLKMDSETVISENLDAYFISTSNLENFIMQLFRWKNRHFIPPLWSIFTTIKTMTLEKRRVKSDCSNSSASPPVAATDSQPIAPTSSNTVLNGSVFTGPDSTDCMTLIAPAADDYNQLNLMPHKQGTDYKVCIHDTGTTQITFHITNLYEGELIVLVNGVIWSQVLSAITSDKGGEEYTVVSGLVPSCSYDIQFVNRFSEGEDYLIADLMVRTCNKTGETKKPLDFSFPSYYHRKFLSPVLTLKHSVLTTNTNLAEERAKLKKNKKEISKKLSTLRQQIDHLKSKISQNASQDGKNALKMDNLKNVLQQSEAQLTRLEDELKDLLEQEQQVEREHLQQKDKHLQNQMESGKLQATLEKDVEEHSLKLVKLQQELTQLIAKRDKMNVKQQKLRKEVSQCTEDMENFKSQFLSQRQRDREYREELRIVEANDYELKVKGLEQDISRLEGENEAMHNMIRNF